MDTEERGNLANEFLHSRFWIDYLGPMLEQMEKGVVARLKEHRTGNQTEDSYLFNSLQATLATLEVIRAQMEADVEEGFSAAQDKGSSFEPDLSEVGLPAVEE